MEPLVGDQQQRDVRGAGAERGLDVGDEQPARGRLGGEEFAEVLHGESAAQGRAAPPFGHSAFCPCSILGVYDGNGPRSNQEGTESAGQGGGTVAARVSGRRGGRSAGGRRALAAE